MAELQACRHKLIRMVSHRIRELVYALALLGCAVLAQAREIQGTVTFGGLPVPGATIIATQGEKKFTAVSDQGGAYHFDDLSDGA